MRILNTLIITTICLYATFANGQFIQKGSDLSGSNNDHYFGSATALSEDGKTLIVGAAELPIAAPISVEGVKVYTWHNNSWVQKGLPIYPASISHMSGFSISTNRDGNIIAIGNPYDTNNVKIYEWNGSAWVQKGMDIDGEATNDLSGYSISLNSTGDMIAIGAPNNAGNGSNAGHVRIYEWNPVGSTWVQKGIDIDGEAANDLSGSSVSLNNNGDIVAIGAPANEGNGTSAGHVRIYEWSGSAWIQKGMDVDGATFYQAGTCVSLNANGNILVVGEPGDALPSVPYSGRVRVFEWIGPTWIQKGTNIGGSNQSLGSSVSISNDGNTIVAGDPTFEYVEIHNWNGNTWVQEGMNINGESIDDDTGSSVSLSGDGSTLAIGSPSSNQSYLYAGQVRIFTRFGVSGSTYLEVNQNCQKDAQENNLSNQRLVINPGNITIQTTTRGYWGIDSLPAGTYTISPDTTSSNNYQPCTPSYTFTVVHPDSITRVQPIGYESTNQCSDPNISINAPFLRPGFSNQIVHVYACNGFDATTALNNTYAIVTLDSLLTVNTASRPYTTINNNTFRVDLGNLFPGQCERFSFDCTLSQNAILGRTLCMEAKLYPIDSCALDSIPNVVSIPCTTPFDNSHLNINASCNNNDTLSFTINNTGADMSCWSQTRLYVDGILTQIDSIQLQAQQDQIFSYAGDGRTWRMEVDQHPLHWGNSQPSATIELCGDPANWTSDLVNILPQDDADPVIDIYCGLVKGSYDPNDKTGFPTGIGTTHDILPNQKIEYLIRFQNTGTDTAFTVVIRDTLSTDFDIFSVQSGVSSHDYSFRMYGTRVLEWTFNNIMLPDSNVNEPLSNGFVRFEVQQQPNLPNGTILENSAGIYFDFNAPIITNTSSHTINDGVIFLDMTEVITKEMALKVYPNPTRDYITIELDEEKATTITLVNNLGQVILSKPSTGKNTSIQLQQLPAGIYYLSVYDGAQTAVQKIIKQ